MKKTIAARVDADLWGAFKLEAIRQGSSVQAFLADALEEKIASAGNKRKNKKSEPINKKPENPESSRAPVNTINKHFNSTVINKTINKLTHNNNKVGLVAEKPKNAYLSVQAAYNSITENESRADHLPGFKLCKRIGKNRKTGIDRLLKELAGTGITPTDYFSLCCLNRHWRGDNDRRWRADLEFLTRDENISKALELEQTDNEANKPITSADFFPDEPTIIDVTTDQRGQPWQHIKH